MAFDIDKYAGAGTENLDKTEDMPLIIIVQSGSPEVKVSHKDHSRRKIEGVKEGDLVFRPERLILPQPLDVIVLESRVLYVEWKPDNGGLVGHHDESILANESYKDGEFNGKFKRFLGTNEIVKTYYFFVRFMHESEWKEGIIAMKSTDTPTAKEWNRKLSEMPMYGEAKAPIFTGVWQISTTPESKDGNDWMGWLVSENPKMLNLETDEELLKENVGIRGTIRLPEPKPVAQIEEEAEVL